MKYFGLFEKKEKRINLTTDETSTSIFYNPRPPKTIYFDRKDEGLITQVIIRKA